MRHLTLINHASVLVETDNVGLLTDPWYEGSAFSNGWELITSTPKFDVNRVTHVWISHEHPDHFSPRTLHALFSHIERPPTFLYKFTKDQRVVSFLRKSGFEVVELEDSKPYSLGDSMIVTSKAFGTDDSALIIETPFGNLVNSNDCIATKADIAQLSQFCSYLPSVDYLLTQFAIAGKIGEENDDELRQVASKAVRQLAFDQARTLGARSIIPIASFKYFSHIENFYMNRGNSTVEQFYCESQERGLHMSVLYPGDSLELGRHLDDLESTSAIERYRADWDRIRPLSYAEKSAQLEDLIEQGGKWAKENWEFHSRTTLRILAKLPSNYSLRPITIHVTDLEQVVELSVRGLAPVNKGELNNSLQISSSMLLHMLTETYGAMSVLISGRLAGPAGQMQRFRVFAQLSTMRGSGIQLDFGWLVVSFKRLISFVVSRRL